jgi:hypothetical protein
MGSTYLAVASGAGSTQLVIEQDVQFSAGTHILGVFFKQTAGTLATVNLTASTGQTKDLSVFNPSLTGPMGATGATGPVGPPGGGSTIVSARACRNAALSLVASTFTALVCDLKQWDTQNAYNPSTGTFTAPVAGKYRVEAQCGVTSVGSTGNSLIIRMFKNGAIDAQNYSHCPAASQFLHSRTIDTVDLVPGDTITFDVYCNGAVTVGTGNIQTYITVDLLSGTGPAGPTGPTGPAAGPYNLVYYQTIPAPKVATNPYTVRHGLGTTFPLVQLWDASTLQFVVAQMTVVDANNVAIRVTSDMPNPVNVVVMGVAGSPVPINPGDYATKLYVDQRTPSLPAPITSGSGVQSFTDSLGDVWVAANGVKGGNWYRARDVLQAKVSRGSAYTTSTSATAIPWVATSFDAYGMWNGAGSFIAPIAGIYQAKVAVGVNFTGAGQWGLLYMTQSSVGGNAQGFQTLLSGTATASLIAEDLLQCTAGDTITSFLQTSVALSLWTNSAANRFHLSYIGTG